MSHTANQAPQGAREALPLKWEPDLGDHRARTVFGTYFALTAQPRKEAVVVLDNRPFGESGERIYSAPVGYKNIDELKAIAQRDYNARANALFGNAAQAVPTTPESHQAAPPPALDTMPDNEAQMVAYALNGSGIELLQELVAHFKLLVDGQEERNQALGTTDGYHLRREGCAYGLRCAFNFTNRVLAKALQAQESK